MLRRLVALLALAGVFLATYLTLQRGLSYEREYAAWCRWAVEYLREQAGPGRSGDG